VERAPNSSLPHNDRHPGKVLFDAIFYFIPRTFERFSDAEISLFRELQQLAPLIPIISKADMYTDEELTRTKLSVSEITRVAVASG
jgi:septin family protein